MNYYRHLYNTRFRQVFWLPLCFIQYNTLSAQEPDYAIPPENEYTSLSGFYEGRAAFSARGIILNGYIDAEQNRVIAPEFDKANAFREGLAAVAVWDSANGYKYGYIDKQGNTTIPLMYSEARDFSNGMAAVSEGKDKSGRYKWMYIDKNGQVLFHSPYTGDDPGSLNSGRLLVWENGLAGYVDRSGNRKIPPQYERAFDFSDGVAIVKAKVKKKRKYKSDLVRKLAEKLEYDAYEYNVIDTLGHMLFKTDVSNLNNFNDGVAVYMEDGKWGLMNKKGKVILKARYHQQPYDFKNGLSLVQVNGEEQDNKDGSIHVLNTSGEVVSVIPLCNDYGCIYDSRYGFYEGLLAVRIVSGKESGWGYIDIYGNLQVSPQFSEAFDFAGGLALVKTLKGKLAVIKKPLLK
ncbi:WG repeat-containing protein [Sinomicrobium sp. M5D2P17]